MNQIDFYTKCYYYLLNYGMPTWIMGIPRFIVRKFAYRTLPSYLNKPACYSKNKADDLIISFTSFPARINNVWWVVECMLRQTLQPSKIILWLSKEQFPTKENIPGSLRNRENGMFEIRMVDGDIRSHKKYLYACREFPDATIMLIDDDILYPTNFVENNYNMFKKTGKIICNFGNIIGYGTEGTPLPYLEWKTEYGYSEDDNFFFGSGGGVMFKPSELYKDLTNIDLALQLTPLADDIWLNAMVRIAGLKTIKLKYGLTLPVKTESDNITLAESNLSGGGNDKQLQRLNDYYLKEIGKRVF